MKKRHNYLTLTMGSVVAAGGIFFASALWLDAGGPPLKEKPCGVCHSDYQKILPPNHPTLGDAAKNPCLTCHKPDPSRNEPTKFSTLIHAAHKEGGKVTLSCNACHVL